MPVHRTDAGGDATCVTQTSRAPTIGVHLNQIRNAVGKEQRETSHTILGALEHQVALKNLDTKGCACDVVAST